jgi:hypothetical protein
MEVYVMNQKPGSGSKPEDARHQKNEGEGNKTAARQYNKDQREFVKSGRVDKAADEAAKAVNSPERDELQRAEDKGRSHAKE